MQRKIVLDTETTGLDPKQGHRIIEIGAVELNTHNYSEFVNVFHCYLNPDRDIPKESYNVHGLSYDFLADKPRFHEVIDQFLQFIDGAQLIIHNADFDMQFLNYELFRIRMPPIPNTGVIDTLKLARKRFPKERVNLDALCHKFNIDTSQRKFHGALKDAKLLAMVYYHMTKSMQSVLLAQEHREQGIIISRLNSFSRHSTNDTVCILPNTEELTKHQHLLSKIDKSLWDVT